MLSDSNTQLPLHHQVYIHSNVIYLYVLRLKAPLSRARYKSALKSLTNEYINTDSLGHRLRILHV